MSSLFRCLSRRKAAVFTLASLSFLGASTLPAAPQAPGPDQDQAPPANDQSLIRENVDLVNIFFTVRTKKGQLIPNLQKSDFTLYEDGKQQTIQHFSRETDLPLTLGLLIDISASQGNLIDIEKDAASAFFSDVIRKKDEAFLISFGKDTELLQDYTNSPRLLKAGLQDLRGDEGGGPPMIGRSPVPVNTGTIPDMGPPKGTLLYDAVYLASDQKLKPEVGRKALILITDGEDQGSHYNLKEAVEAAQKSDAIIYSIYYVDRAFYSQGGFMIGGGGGESALRKMSEETGGRVFTVKRNHSLQDVFKEIQDEMRNQYSIGYVPTNTVRDGSFRRIQIKTSDKHYKVQARSGYYATPNDVR